MEGQPSGCHGTGRKRRWSVPGLVEEGTLFEMDDDAMEASFHSTADSLPGAPQPASSQQHKTKKSPRVTAAVMLGDRSAGSAPRPHSSLASVSTNHQAHKHQTSALPKPGQHKQQSDGARSPESSVQSMAAGLLDGFEGWSDHGAENDGDHRDRDSGSHSPGERRETGQRLGSIGSDDGFDGADDADSSSSSIVMPVDDAVSDEVPAFRATSRSLDLNLTGLAEFGMGDIPPSPANGPAPATTVKPLGELRTSCTSTKQGSSSTSSPAAGHSPVSPSKRHPPSLPAPSRSPESAGNGLANLGGLRPFQPTLEPLSRRQSDKLVSVTSMSDPFSSNVLRHSPTLKASDALNSPVSQPPQEDASPARSASSSSSSDYGLMSPSRKSSMRQASASLVRKQMEAARQQEAILWAEAEVGRHSNASDPNAAVGVVGSAETLTGGSAGTAAGKVAAKSAGTTPGSTARKDRSTGGAHVSSNSNVGCENPQQTPSRPDNPQIGELHPKNIPSSLPTKSSSPSLRSPTTPSSGAIPASAVARSRRVFRMSSSSDSSSVDSSVRQSSTSDVPTEASPTQGHGTTPPDDGPVASDSFPCREPAVSESVAPLGPGPSSSFDHHAHTGRVSHSSVPSSSFRDTSRSISGSHKAIGSNLSVPRTAAPPPSRRRSSMWHMRRSPAALVGARGFLTPGSKGHSLDRVAPALPEATDEQEMTGTGSSWFGATASTTNDDRNAAEPSEPPFIPSKGQKPARPPSACTRMGFFLKTDVSYALFIALHTAASLVVFAHFFFRKWEQQAGAVPSGAPHHWQKRVVPSIEFASMHVLLLNMGLLPLTMCRATITHLRSTWIGRYAPFNHMTSFHIYLGTVMVFQLIVLVALFFGHFGSLCAAHKDGREPVDFCDNFSSEIMITGYVIFGIVLAMGFTAIPAIRRRIPFEAFLGVHHLFLVLYAVTIAHTMDKKGRKDLDSRSQTFKWVTGPLAVYFLDRAYRWFRQRQAFVVQAHFMQDPQAAVIRMRLAGGAKLRFEAGQYVQVKVPSVSKVQWHPFAISSSPRNSDEIEILLQVVDSSGRPCCGSSQTWSSRVFDALQASAEAINATDPHRPSPRGLEVLIEGPYGTSLDGALSFKQIVMVSTGTGVAPTLSLLRQLVGCGKLLFGDDDWRTPLDGKQRMMQAVPPKQKHPTSRPNMAPSAGPVPVSGSVSGSGSGSGSSSSSVPVPGPSPALAHQPSAGRLEATIPPISHARRMSSQRSRRTSRRSIHGGSGFINAGRKLSHAQDRHFVQVSADPLRAMSEWLGSVRRDNAYVAAHRHTAYFLYQLLCAILDFTLLFTEISWYYSTPEMTYVGPRAALDCLTLATVCVYAVSHLTEQLPSLAGIYGNNFGPRSSRDRSSFALQMLLIALMFVTMFQSWGSPAEDASDLATRSFLRAYRVGWLLVSSPLFFSRGGGSIAERSTSSALVTRVRLLWAIRGFHMAEWLIPALQQIDNQLRTSTGDDEYLDVQLNITQVSPREQRSLLAMVAGTSLEDCVSFGRPDLPRSIRALCDEQVRRLCVFHPQTGTLRLPPNAVAPPIGIVFCGSHSLSKELCESVLSNPSRSMVPLVYLSDSTIQDGYHKSSFGLVEGSHMAHLQTSRWLGASEIDGRSTGQRGMSLVWTPATGFLAPLNGPSADLLAAVSCSEMAGLPSQASGEVDSLEPQVQAQPRHQQLRHQDQQQQQHQRQQQHPHQHRRHHPQPQAQPQPQPQPQPQHAPHSCVLPPVSSTGSSSFRIEKRTAPGGKVSLLPGPEGQEGSVRVVLKPPPDLKPSGNRAHGVAVPVSSGPIHKTIRPSGLLATPSEVSRRHITASPAGERVLENRTVDIHPSDGWRHVVGTKRRSSIVRVPQLSGSCEGSVTPNSSAGEKATHRK